MRLRAPAVLTNQRHEPHGAEVGLVERVRSTTISLCPDACTAAKANGAFEITFFCVTRTVN